MGAAKQKASADLRPGQQQPSLSPEKISQDNHILALREHADQVMSYVNWGHFSALQWDKFLLGYTLAGVINPTSPTATAPPGCMTIRTTAMQDSAGINTMFKPLLDAVDYSKVGQAHAAAILCC